MVNGSNTAPGGMFSRRSLHFAAGRKRACSHGSGANVRVWVPQRLTAFAVKHFLHSDVVLMEGRPDPPSSRVTQGRHIFICSRGELRPC
jgi:hypothetical protein